MNILASMTQRASGAMGRGALMQTASLAALSISTAMAMVATPAQAQLMRLRTGASVTAAASATRATTRPASMRDALVGQQAAQARAAQVRTYVTAARQAALASALRANPADGIGPLGLYPVRSIRDAMAAQADPSLNTTQKLAAATNALAAARAANDPTGKATWDGAELPVETAANGQTTVSITQTQSRALLSWDRFDVGANTTVRFNQTQNGVPQTTWTAVNRVVDAQNPTTILGKIVADGAVYILNSRGVIFGKGSQVNLRSLVASSLELGNYASANDRTASGGSSSGSLAGLSLQARNIAYLNNGVLPSATNPTYGADGGAPPLFLSPMLSTTAVTKSTTGSSIDFDPIEGDVIVDPGAIITTSAGGMLVLAAPRVENYGSLIAQDGQVSLIGGRLVTFARSDGSDTSVDPNVRGLIFRSLDRDNQLPSPTRPTAPDDGIVINRGFIESRRGYLSLVATARGDVINEGLLSSTTSVSRNGKIALYAGRVTIGGSAIADQAGAITILPDEDGETIPQGSPNEPAQFKRSQIEIGALAFTQTIVSGQPADDLANPVGRLVQSTFAMGENALIYAPNADVNVGKSGQSQLGILNTPAAQSLYAPIPSSISIGDNALVDVSGLKDVSVDVARNFITITPVKRNELRDTPTYREVVVDDSFTLNGQTLTVDIRRTGERDDGVRWVGSPLIEAGSLASQIPVTVSELMTTGGNVSFASSENVSLGKGATVNFSGGWVNYTGAEPATSRLVTADGRIVDIGDADRNDNFVSVYSGFTATQPRFGVVRRYLNPIVAGNSTASAYDEGRDAGSFVVEAAATRIDGALQGSAYAGERQLADAVKPTASSTIRGDTRKLQASAGQMPSGGYVRLPTFGDIVVYKGSLNAAQSGFSQMMLNDAMLSAAGLSALSLEAFGQIIFAGAGQSLLQAPGAFSLTGDSSLTLAPGATLTAKANRSIIFDGDVRIASGTIDAKTSGALFAINNGGTSTGVVDRGSEFRTDDDVFGAYSSGAGLPSPYDIVVNGTLSTAGRWTNDTDTTVPTLGKAWGNGGSINLTVAANMFVGEGASVATATTAVDLSGSILINAGGRLDVSAGGYLGATGLFDLSGKGGNVTLNNATRYAGITASQRAQQGSPGRGEQFLYGDNQTVGFTALPDDRINDLGPLVPSLVPSVLRSRVEIADGAISAFGFSGGGTFRLVSPDIAFGSETPGVNATRIGLDFAAQTGFGALDLTSNRSKIVSGLFNNGQNYLSAFADTTSFTVRAGETFDLTRTVLPFAITGAERDALAALATGGDIRTILAPTTPEFAYDRKAINLTIGGLGELVVESGGVITGAPNAVITAPKLINSGTISLPSGVLRQLADAPSQDVLSRFLGVHSLSELLGAESGNDEAGLNLLGISANGQVLTNKELFTLVGSDRLVSLLGQGDEATGIRLDAGSITDLSGTALFDPRAPFIRNAATGAQVQARTGRLTGGGSILSLSTLRDDSGPILSSFARTVDILPGAIVDLSGTSQSFDEYVLGVGYVPRTQWSAGGTLSMLNSGTIAGAKINAYGGYGDDGGAFVRTGTINTALLERRALGGTLELGLPTITQVDTGIASSGIYSASQIEAAGFDTLAARGGLRADGDVNLRLRKALLVSSVITRSGELAVGRNFSIGANSGANATFSAPFIGFSAHVFSPIVPSDITEPTITTPGTVNFIAGAPGIDFTGTAFFSRSIGTLNFQTPGDIRFIGVDGRSANDRAADPTGTRLNGEIITFANTTFDGGRIYATTGTGNLQLFADAERAGTALPSNTRPFQIAAYGNHDIRFASTKPNDVTPLSAGSYLRVVAQNIAQDGLLYAPIGRLDLGAASFAFGTTAESTQSVIFGANSITSVSGAGQKIPYGTTLDLKEYFFTPLSNGALSTLPNSELRVSGDTIDVQSGATVNLSGGGDVFAYEFVSGIGGSRDVLDRFNTDAFSSNLYDAAAGKGYQFSDKRQVFAIIPKSQFTAMAAFDPLYSADYGAAGPVDLYGAQAGRTVVLDGSGGIPAGEYVLLPAHYALLDGAYRVVENVGKLAPDVGAAQTLRDGSVLVGGSYGFADTGIVESERRSFTVQSAATFKSYSRLETQSGSDAITALNQDPGDLVPRLPRDAARLILSPLNALRVMGVFDTSTVSGARGVDVDIDAENIIIAPDSQPTTAGYVTLYDSALQRLNPESLFIGGTRALDKNGLTNLRVDANEIIVRTGASLALPEVLLAVGNELNLGNAFDTSRLTIEDGASIVATGALSRPDISDYIIHASTSATDPGDDSGSGSVIRVATGAERAVRRTGAAYDPLVNKNTFLDIGAATLAGESVSINTTRFASIDNALNLNATNLTIGGDGLVFSDTGINTALRDKFAAATNLTLRSSKMIGFAAGGYNFNNLTIDAPGIGLDQLTKASVGQTNVVTIDTARLRLENSAAALAACKANQCGTSDDMLTITSDELSFGNGTVRTFGFGGTVELAATGGMFVEGVGKFDTGLAGLTLTTPFLADRAALADPRQQKVRPEYSFGARGDIVLTAGGASVPIIDAISGNRAPGARFTFEDADTLVAAAIPAPRNISIQDSLVLATAGLLKLDADSIALGGSATLATPGWTKSFGDSLDRVIVAASGGAIDMLARTGGIDFAAGTTLISDTGIGNAGAISLRAPNGAINFAGTLNPGLNGARQGDFIFDSGTGGFDFAAFVANYGTGFGGKISVRTGAGNLDLNAGQALKARSLSLTADGGSITVAGSIDTSGVDVSSLSLTDAKNAAVNGGAISLYGLSGVTLTSTARLDTHTTGFAAGDPRSASAGDVTIGIGNVGGAITIASGAVVDVGARRTQAAQAAGLPANRLVAEFAKEPGTLVDRTVYRFVEADKGGDISLRAPLIGAAMDQVDISLPSQGAFVGANSVQVEAYRSFDLDAIAVTPGVSGVTATASGVVLDPSADDAGAYGSNFLSGDFVMAGGLPSISHFIRNFSVSARDGSSFTGLRLRPGVDLLSSGTITLNSAWNLAAASVDEQAAFNAGYLQLIPQLGNHASGYGLNSAGTPYYSVVAGQEGAMLADRNVTNFYYRVGGNAGGEAPVIRLRGASDVTVAASITDGFFVFRDRSDEAYASYQLGGGNRVYDPAVRIVCGTISNSDCQGLDQFTGVITPNNNAASARINLANITYGSDAARYSATPFSAEANSPAALGNVFDYKSGDRIAGAGLEYGELFPLLPGGVAMTSSDIAITAGGSSSPSVNPDYVNVTKTADIIVTDVSTRSDGSTSTPAYNIGTAPLVPSFSANLGIISGNSGAGPIGSTPFADLFGPNVPQEFIGLDPNTYTQLLWGGLSAEGQQYFAARAATWTGTQNNPTGVVAPLGEVIQFIQTYAPQLLGNVASGGTHVIGAPQGAIKIPAAQHVHMQTFVRTGDGDITMNAARDVDLTGSAQPVYRKADGSNATIHAVNGYQVGGAAVYTAGQRVAPGVMSAQLANTAIGLNLSGGLFAPKPEDITSAPTSAGRTDHQPVIAFNGGNVDVDAGRDVLGRLDLWTAQQKPLTFGARQADLSLIPGTLGLANQSWRAGVIGVQTEVGILPEYFGSGIGALAGGDVSINAGRDVSDLTVALDSSLTKTPGANTDVLATFGSGNFALTVGRDLNGGQFDVTNGQSNAHIGRNVTTFTTPGTNEGRIDNTTFRLENASIAMIAGGQIDSLDAYGLGAGYGSASTGDVPADRSLSNAGLYSPITAISATALGDVTFGGGNFAPPTLELASLEGSVKFTAKTTLYPSPVGQLTLLSAGDIGDFSVAMLDLDPTLLAQSAFASGTGLAPGASLLAGSQDPVALLQRPADFPGINDLISEGTRRLMHNSLITHRNDFTPARIYTDGSITNTSINLPKFANIGAGVDIIDTFFVGQNVRASDETRIYAGRDIGATTQTIGSPGGLPYFNATSFYLGGPGVFSVEAGRNLGPFATSAVLRPSNLGNTTVSVTYAGGILTVGNDYNPWLSGKGADLNVSFGVGPGQDLVGLRETYLNPALFGQLDGDLFVQTKDAQGVDRPDRSRPVYAPILARWLRDNEPALFDGIFGGQAIANDTALDTAAYAAMPQLYAAFSSLSLQRQRRFLVSELYFNELSQPSLPTSPSFQQYIRGYRAIEALFPTALGYTDNLAAYETDPATINADHPLGVPRRKLVNGQPVVADRVVTGNADVRLSTWQTVRGGDLTILAPGGDLLVGSVARTAEQTARRNTRFIAGDRSVVKSVENGDRTSNGGGAFDSASSIRSIPVGYEGLMTLRGGDIRSFTDGSLRLNQSRLFTISGGDITAWSSNGDLNAGQGPKSAANFPPVRVRFDLNGNAETDTAGGVAGAGIGAFKQKPTDPNSRIILVAPVGEVDAGDAGVRASGSIFVAAARVANADNFAAGGSISGVPTSAPVAAAAPPSSAASAVANVARVSQQDQANRDRRTSISVDVLGFAGGDKCKLPDANDEDCPK